MEVAKAMLHDQDLPMHIWMEAARTAVYVQNHTPHRVLKNTTPEEVFLVRNQKSVISEYLAIQCTYTFQKRRELNSIL